MIEVRRNKLPYVLFEIRGGLFAVPSESVREIVILPAVTPIPGVPPEIRGVINLRGRVIQLVDLRVKLGLPSAETELNELIQLLHDREQDHHNWLKELEACVREHRPFKLARDSHSCKFGQWYDRYQTDNSLLKMVLRKMDEPHKAIHASAAEILTLSESGNQDGALASLTERRNGELAVLSGLFDEARRLLRENHRELAVVMSHEEKRFAITIDRVEAVERLPENEIEPMPAVMGGGSHQQSWRVSKRLKTQQTVLLLDENYLCSATAN